MLKIQKLSVDDGAENYNMLTDENVYPGGEGAGYAGGIMSAAVDGIRVAEHILKQNYNNGILLCKMEYAHKFQSFSFSFGSYKIEPGFQ